MTNVLLEDLALAVRANEAGRFKSSLDESLHELGKPVLKGLVVH